jgi:hypothetical protein
MHGNFLLLSKAAQIDHRHNGHVSDGELGPEIAAWDGKVMAFALLGLKFDELPLAL